MFMLFSTAKKGPKNAAPACAQNGYGELPFSFGTFSPKYFIVGVLARTPPHPNRGPAQFRPPVGAGHCGILAGSRYSPRGLSCFHTSMPPGMCGILPTSPRFLRPSWPQSLLILTNFFSISINVLLLLLNDTSGPVYVAVL